MRLTKKLATLATRREIAAGGRARLEPGEKASATSS